MELNPDNPTTQALRGQWYKLLAVVLWKYRDVLPEEVVITGGDIDELVRAFPGGPVIVGHDRADGLHLRVVDQAEGQRLAREVRASN